MANTTRDRLINTAFELFGHNGFHGVGIDRIIEEVGVTKTTFYNHFESKDDLILAVLDERHSTEMRVLQETLRRIGGINARGQLESIFTALDDWFNQPDFRGCIFITAAAEFPLHHDPAHQSAARHASEVRELVVELAEHAGADDPDELAEQLTLLINGAIVARHVVGDQQTVWRADRLARALIDQHLSRAQQPPQPAAVPPPVHTPRLVR